MAKTRSKPAAKSARKDPEPDTTTITNANANVLPPDDENPPKLFVLPKDTSQDARIVTLANPATTIPSRYLFCPEKGFYEFTKIAAPKKAPRSWLITKDKEEKVHSDVEETSAEESDNASETGKEEEDASPLSKGYITKAADLFVTTPIDLLFMILPALSPTSAKDQKQLFLALDDHLDRLSSSTPHVRQLLRDTTLREKASKRMEAFCDTVDAGDEKMYRLSEQKLLEILLKKAERMTKNGLPASMEEKFVRTALEAPIMSIRREESNISIATEPTSILEDAAESQQSQSAETDTQETSTPSTTTDSQSTVQSVSTTATTVASETSTEEVGVTAPLSAPQEVVHLLRLRTALSLLLESYIPPILHAPLRTLLSTPSPPSIPDFSPLEAHLAHLTSLRAEAMALRSLSDNISRKRGYENDDEAAEARAEKKRRKDEEEKKKKGESRGVKQLKKVDTSGMKKLSSFFTRAPVKKA